MIYKLEPNIVETLLLPPLEILADFEYQARIWVDHPDLAIPYWELVGNFLEISKALLSPGDEERLEEKNRESLKELHKMVDKFEVDEAFFEDIKSLINHSDWIIIQQKSKKLAEALQPSIKAFHHNMIKNQLIPTIEKLTFALEEQIIFKDGYSYFESYMDLSELCDLLLLPHDKTLNQKDKQQLKNLYKKIDTFDDEWDRTSFPINNPEWVEIQQFATKFLLEIESLNNSI